jgi:hypothetical protein
MAEKNKAKDSPTKEQEDYASCAVGKEHKAGRPLYWTEEVIEDFAEELLAWSQKSSSIIIGDFAVEKNYDPVIMRKLSTKNKKFRSAYKNAKRRIGARREKGTMLNKFNPIVYTKTARMYDDDLSDFKKEELAAEELIKAQAKIKALNTELKNKGAIIEYLELQKSVDEVAG